jgi:2,4-diketo-3-deoxy-L-fuconate hydrolase
MKLARIRTSTGVCPVIIDANGIPKDLSAHIDDITPANIDAAALKVISDIDVETLSAVAGDYAPFLSDVRRVFCIGLNYSDHAKESGLPIPDFPILFMKSCPVSGANDPITIPKGSQKTDWEVELGVVIGTETQHVSEDNALDHVAGYFVANDVSERAFQSEFGGQWTKGKSCDTFGPIGPWFVTKDEVPDPQKLDMYLDVNGMRCQTGNTGTMIFSVKKIVSFLSSFMTLRPGDIIITGTPPGVGMGMKPEKFLRPGDVVTLGIEGLGDQRQDVVAFNG